jgi:uncharacterized protein YrrD
MLINTHHIYGSSVVAIDKTAGSVRDLLFDDRTWAVRFLVVHSGRWLTGQSELLTPDVIDRADWMSRQLSVRLTMDEVIHSPPADEHPPASRGRELQQSKLIAWDVYWTGWLDESEPAGDPHLDSVKEVTGYHLEAEDGEIGHVADFLVDDQSWAIRYLVMDTRNWLPGKHSLVVPSLVKSIDWNDRLVHVSLSRDKLREAPPFEVTVPVTRDYEEKLCQYYGVARYWSDTVPAE